MNTKFPWLSTMLQKKKTTTHIRSGPTYKVIDNGNSYEKICCGRFSIELQNDFSWFVVSKSFPFVLLYLIKVSFPQMTRQTNKLLLRRPGACVDRFPAYCRHQFPSHLQAHFVCRIFDHTRLFLRELISRLRNFPFRCRHRSRPVWYFISNINCMMIEY